MDRVIKRTINYTMLILVFLILPMHITVGEVASQSSLSVSIVDLYSSPPYSIKSRSTSQIQVHVSSEGGPLSGAVIEFSTNPIMGGSLAPETGVTDDNGDVFVIYTPPIVSSPSSVLIKASAAKTGFIKGEAEMEIQIQPSIDITVTSDMSTLKPEQKTQINVYVTLFGTEEPVNEANVELNSLTGGTFSESSGRTNEIGEFTTEYTPPYITEGTILISTTVEKSEFEDKTTSWMTLTINEAGLPAPTLISPAAEEVVGTQPILKWEPVNQAREYEVFLKNSQDTSEAESSYFTTSNSFTPNQPLDQARYNWKVRAVDTLGVTGPMSEIRSFSVRSIIPNITLPSGGEVIIRANITPWNSPIKSVSAIITKPDSSTDKLEMYLKDGFYEGLFLAPQNIGEEPMEFEVNLIAEDTQGEVATSAYPKKFIVIPRIKRYNLTIKTAPEGLSTIPVSGVYEYAKGSNVTLSNEQSSVGKFVFDYWLVDGVKSGDTITMEDNHVAVAVFKAVEIEEEPIPEVFIPITTPPSETVIFTEEPETTMPPTTLAPTTSPPVSSETEPTTYSFRKIVLLIIFSGASIVILLKIKPEIRKKKVPGMPLDDVESIEEVSEVEAKVIEVKEPEIVEEAVEEPEEAAVVEPDVLEIESVEEPVEEVEEIIEAPVIEAPVIEDVKIEAPIEISEIEEVSKVELEEPVVKGIVEEEPEIVEEVPEIPEEAIEVDSETLGSLKIIMEIGDIYERAALGLLFRKSIKQDPKKTMHDVRAHLDEAVALGLVKKEFLKNMEGVIEVNYSLTSKGKDCLNTTS